MSHQERSSVGKGYPEGLHARHGGGPGAEAVPSQHLKVIHVTPEKMQHWQQHRQKLVLLSVCQ
eukprot:1153724-Pelagomonas_calceolata.AAC.5